MNEMIIGFAHYLRNNRFSIPTSVIEEALLALPFVDVFDQEEVKITLSQLWIKDVAQLSKFQECFHEYFFYKCREQWNNQQKEEAMASLKNELDDFSEIQKDERKKKQQTTPEAWLLQQLKECGNKATQAFQKEIQGTFHDQYQYAKDDMKHITEEDINSLAEELAWNALASEQAVTIFDALDNTRESLLNRMNLVNKLKTKEKEALSLVEKNLLKGMRKMIVTHEDTLQNRPFPSLKEEDIALIKESLKRSSLDLMTKLSKLLKASYLEEQLDLQQTIANSMKTYGIPMELMFRKRKRNRTKIHVLLDVSGSVIKSAEILSLFSYLLYKQFPLQVKTMAFVGLLDETTRFYDNDNMNDGIQESLLHANIDYRGYSNYGKSLDLYKEKFLEEVDKNTIIIMLGDARNNRNPTSEHILKKMYETSRCICWFNPEPKNKWNQGDSKMKVYQPYCHIVKETENTNQLLIGLESLVNYLQQERTTN